MQPTTGHGAIVPTPLTALVGREREVAELAALLGRTDARLMTLTGPGGVGKTRLAIAAVREVAGRFADGVRFVGLAPISDHPLVAPTIAQALALPDAADPPLDRLVSHLAGKSLLLVLDNYEHVAEAAPLVGELLGSCPKLTVLVTSRVPLKISGEREYPVAPLGVVDRASRVSLDDAVRSDAVQLFVERARGVRPDFALDVGTAPVVAEICRRLDGLPLAIELAAARAKILPPAALLARLERRLPLLTGGNRDLPARQRTMRDAIAWSHDLLTPEEQVLFRRLAVFAGGFTLEAAEAVVPSPDEPRSHVLDGVASLVDKSLVRAEAGPRYLMLETIREYAAEQLDASDDAGALRERHATYFAGVASSATPPSPGATPPDGWSWTGADVPNLRAAGTWALEHGRADLALRLGTATQPFLYFRADAAEAARALQGALGAPGHIDPGLHADALWAAATLTSLSDLAGADALVAEAMAVARAHGDRFRIARGLNMAGALAEWAGDYDRAIALNEEGLAVLAAHARDPDPEIGGIRALLTCNLADAHLWRGEPQRTIPLAETALAWWRRVGPAWGVGQGLQTLAAAASVTGNQARAAELYDEALTLRLNLEDRAGVAGIVGGVAGIALAGGHRTVAARLLGAAAAIRDRAGVRYGPHYVRGAQVLEAVRGQMNERTFAEAWQAGRALTDDEAVADARRVLVEARQPVELPASAAADLHGLTPREVEVVRLVAAGKSNAEIAGALFISVPTVKRHLTNILAKLELPSRSALNTWAHRHELVEPRAVSPPTT